jgi:hypothetical protein
MAVVQYLWKPGIPSHPNPYPLNFKMWEILLGRAFNFSGSIISYIYNSVHDDFFEWNTTMRAAEPSKYSNVRLSNLFSTALAASAA